MTPLLTLALGSYIVGASHYVRDGASLYYALWISTGAVMVIIEQFRLRALKALEGER